MKKMIWVLMAMFGATSLSWASGGGYGSYSYSRSGSSSYGQSSERKKSTTQARKAPLALDGNCSVCLVEMGAVIPGSAQFKAEYKGMTYYFPSAKQLEMFKSNPTKYTDNIEKLYMKAKSGHMHDHDHDHDHSYHEGSHH